MADEGLTQPLVGRLLTGAAAGLTFAVAGLAGNALGFPLIGNLLVELIDDVFQLLTSVQLVFVGCGHFAFHGLRIVR